MDHNLNSPSSLSQGLKAILAEIVGVGFGLKSVSGLDVEFRGGIVRDKTGNVFVVNGEDFTLTDDATSYIGVLITGDVASLKNVSNRSDVDRVVWQIETGNGAITSYQDCRAPIEETPSAPPTFSHRRAGDSTVAGARATGTLTFTDMPADGQAVTVGGITYTFKDTLASANDVFIGSNENECLINLQAALNDFDTRGTAYHAQTEFNVEAEAFNGVVVGETLEVHARRAGETHNSIETVTNVTGASWPGATLAGGVDILYGYRGGAMLINGEQNTMNDGVVALPDPDSTNYVFWNSRESELASTYNETYARQVGHVVVAVIGCSGGLIDNVVDFSGALDTSFALVARQKDFAVVRNFECGGQVYVHGGRLQTSDGVFAVNQDTFTAAIGEEEFVTVDATGSIVHSTAGYPDGEFRCGRVEMEDAHIDGIEDARAFASFPASVAGGGSGSALERAVIPGGTAGELTVSGITTADELSAVIGYPITGGNVTDVVDLTSEFTITGGDEIDNTGGTDTTDYKLLVLWNGGGGGGTARVYHDITTSGTPVDVEGDDLTGDDWYLITTGGTKGTEIINLLNLSVADLEKAGYKVTFQIFSNPGSDGVKINHNPSGASGGGSQMRATPPAWIEFTCNGAGFDITSSGYFDAEGRYPNPNNKAGQNSHAEGESCGARGECSHAEGTGTTAQGDNAHSEGNNTQATGGYSHSEGDSTQANGTASHAEGTGTTASGANGHAEGLDTVTTGSNSQASGVSSNDNDVDTRQVYASGAFSGDGDITWGLAQASRLVLMKTTTDDSNVPLTVGAEVPAVTQNQMFLADYTTMVITGQIIGRDILEDESSAWRFEAVARRGVGAGSVAFIGSPTVTLIAQDAGASDFVEPTLEADTTNGAFQVNVEGTTGRTIRWIARLDSVEVMGHAS